MRAVIEDTLPDTNSPHELRTWLVEQLERLHFDVRHRTDAGERSWSNAITRRIWLRRSANLDRPSGVALLAHEVTHARQQAGCLPYRLAWGAWYILNPWFRLRAELEAEAWSAAVLFRVVPGLNRRRIAESVHTLGGWRAPHRTPGDPEAHTRAVMLRAAELAP